MPVVLPEYELVRTFGHLDPQWRHEPLYRAFALGAVDAVRMRAALRAVPHIRAARALNTAIEAATAGAESYLEQVGVEMCFPARQFPGLVRQHWVAASGRRYRLDLFDPASMTAIEFDGSGHDAIGQRVRDVRRDADLARLGIQTLRFTYGDVTTRPQWCRETVAAVVARRSAT